MRGKRESPRPAGYCMKTAFLIRHTKSSWDDPALPDTELAHRLPSEIIHMPTCAVAGFTFNAKSWSNIGKARVAKVALDCPKKS